MFVIYRFPVFLQAFFPFFLQVIKLIRIFFLFVTITGGQLTAEEKASVSHRGKALRAFAVALDDYLKGNE